MFVSFDGVNMVFKKISEQENQVRTPPVCVASCVSHSLFI